MQIIFKNRIFGYRIITRNIINMQIKRRLYFDNGSCYTDRTWHTIPPVPGFCRPATSKELYIIESYKYEELQDDEIISQLQNLTTTLNQLKALEIDYGYQSEIDYWRYTLKVVDQKLSNSHINAVKADLLFKMQSLTNIYAHKHGATDEEIEAISYFDHDMIEVRDTANNAINEINRMKTTMIDQPYWSITYDIIKYLANYEVNGQSREVWDKLLREGKIPYNGLCNALNENYQTRTYDFISNKFDVCQKNKIGNVIDKIVYYILANKQKRGYQTHICHVMIAAYLCGIIPTLRNILNTISRRYGCKLNPNQWSRTIKAFWRDVCEHGKSNRKFLALENKKNGYIKNIEDLFMYYIAHNNFDFIATLIPDNKPYYDYFCQFQKLICTDKGSIKSL